MDIYSEWGFRSNPFNTTPLPVSSEGDTLLVGRDAILSAIVRRIYNVPRVPTIEGQNGVGKTSVANVAVFRCFQHFVERRSDVAFLPASGGVLQLDPTTALDAFVEKVWLKVLQSVVEHAPLLRERGFVMPHDLEDVDTWLNTAIYRSGGISVGGFGGSAGKGGTVSKGFQPEEVGRRWVSQLFGRGKGGVLLVIDNLELLETSQAASKTLESMRDRLLTVPGLRWVLCGARGVVLGTASSPRLNGILHHPIQVQGIDGAHAPAILSSRQAVYRRREDLELPLTPDGFGRLYHVLHENLRDSLAMADEFCNYVGDGGKQDFDNWLEQKAVEQWKAVGVGVGAATVEALEYAADHKDGVFYPSDAAEFGFNSVPAFSYHLRNLEQLGVVQSVRVEGDNRRRQIVVTAKGWLALSGRGIAERNVG